MRFTRSASLLAFGIALCLTGPLHADDGFDATKSIYDSAHGATTPAFEEMLAHVYNANPSIAAQRDSLRILDEHAAQATSGFRPTLQAEGSYGEGRVSQNSQAWVSGEDYDMNLAAIQPLYNGATWGQWHAAKSRVRAGRAELLATEQKVLLTAITAWLELCEKQQLLDLNNHNLQLTQSHTEATNQRMQAGSGTQTDVAVAESRLADAQARVSLAEAARDAARSTYERITGLHAQTTRFLPLPKNLPVSQAEAMDLLRHNPEYDQAQETIHAAEDDIDTAEGARGPNLYLKGSMDQQSSTVLNLARLRSDSITINLALPLYQGGIEYSKEREAKIAYSRSKLSAIDVTRGLNDQMHQAWDNYHAAQIVINASQRAVDASGRALSGIQEEQMRGTRTLTEVLDAQAQMLGSQVTEVQAEKNLRLAAYNLLSACGRLTAKDMNLPTNVYDPTRHYDEVTSRWWGTSAGVPGEAAE